MNEKFREFCPELLSSIFVIVLILGCFLLYSVSYPSDFEGEAPVIFGTVDWLIVVIITLFVLIGISFAHLKKKSLWSGLIMILGGSTVFLFAIFKMAYLEDLFHTILYSHYTSYGVNFCTDNVRNWYYFIFISFAGLILVGVWKIIMIYKREEKISVIGKISLLIGVVALIFSFLPSFTNVVNIWFISADSFAFWYMIFALIMGIIAILIGKSAYNEYKSRGRKEGKIGLYGFTAGILALIVSFLSFLLIMVTSIVC